MRGGTQSVPASVVSRVDMLWSKVLTRRMDAKSITAKGHGSFVDEAKFLIISLTSARLMTLSRTSESDNR